MKETIASLAATYFKRFKVKQAYFGKMVPSRDLCLIITIPSYKEPNIKETLDSLSMCQKPSGVVEVLIGINAPSNATDEVRMINQQTVEQITAWNKQAPKHIYAWVIREEEISPNYAGAGFARKIIMDEALHRWSAIDSDGPIVCLDADCKVSNNYFTEIERAFKDQAVKVGHLNFNHPLNEGTDETLRQGIVSYEIHLRCYKQGLQLAGYPLSVYTVGSCMVVRASAYAKVGGMNRRRAGEDFHFLHKLASRGGWIDIKKATVYPSIRVSDRVPFGTGRAQINFKKTLIDVTYNADIYKVIADLFKVIPHWYSGDLGIQFLHKSLKEYLIQQDVERHVMTLREQCKSKQAFFSRFWHWMDGLQVLKIVHYLRDNGFPNQPVAKVSWQIIQQRGMQPEIHPEGLLRQFRELDRNDLTILPSSLLSDTL